MLNHKFEFEHLFRLWSAWYRLRRSMAWLVRGLIFGLALSLGFSLVNLIQEELLKEEYLALIFRFTLWSTSIAALAGLVWPVSKEFLALFFDHYYALHERSRTSLEILEKQKKILAIQDSQGELVENQLKDTLVIGSQVRPQASFFLKITHLQAALVGILAVGLVLTSVFGEPIFQHALEQRLTRQAIAQEAARLETLAEQVRLNENLTPAQRQEITQILEEAARKIKQAQTPEQAVAVLASTENQLKSLEDGQALQQAEGLQNVGKRLLEDNPSGSETPLQSFSQNLAEGDYLGAAQDLANLDLNQLSPEEARSLAEQLEEASQMLDETNPELSRQLAEAAQALRQGDAQAAQQALQQAAQALAESGQQIAQSEVARQTAEQVSQGQERLIQAGSGQSQQAQAEQPGQGQGSQGQGSQGQGSNSQTGSSSQGASGSGAGEGESSGQEGQGPEAGVDPIDQNNQVGDGGLKTYEEIFAPQRLGGSGGEEIDLPGSAQPGDQVVGQGDTQPGDPNNSRVPYVNVLPEYAETYRRAVESGQVPITLRALVKKYFSSLEP